MNLVQKGFELGILKTAKKNIQKREIVKQFEADIMQLSKNKKLKITKIKPGTFYLSGLPEKDIGNLLEKRFKGYNQKSREENKGKK
jgi:hypothetical protein